MDAVAEKVTNHKNLIQTSSGTIASIGLEQSGRKIAGCVVTPATWYLNHVADGSRPGAIDVGLWLAGLVHGPAAIATGLMKAVVDDDIGRKLALVKAKEPLPYAQTINACYNYGMSAPAINAMAVANAGGTAWISNVGLWVYITDKKGKLVADYQPKEFLTLYRPKKPYRAKANGGFDWEITRR